jgi:hypothetical protein
MTASLNQVFNLWFKRVEFNYRFYWIISIGYLRECTKFSTFLKLAITYLMLKLIIII